MNSTSSISRSSIRVKHMIKLHDRTHQPLNARHSRGVEVPAARTASVPRRRRSPFPVSRCVRPAVAGVFPPQFMLWACNGTPQHHCARVLCMRIKSRPLEQEWNSFRGQLNDTNLTEPSFSTFPELLELHQEAIFPKPNLNPRWIPNGAKATVRASHDGKSQFEGRSRILSWSYHAKRKILRATS